MIIFVLCTGYRLTAQEENSDSTKVGREKQKPEEFHSPKKAAIFSAVLPGLGQAYNKKYLKIPIIYAGFGAIGYFIDWNNDNYHLNRTAYMDLTDTLETTNSHVKIAEENGYNLDNPTSRENFKDGLIKRQDYYRRNRDMLFITMFGLWGLNIIDASVDAHLFQFDVSDDLTLHWQPSVMSINHENIYCIRCTFSF